MVAAAFEADWRNIEASGVSVSVPARSAIWPEPFSVTSTVPTEKTMREVFELFRSDPAKQRTRKTDLHYLNLIELTVGLWGERRTIRSIDVMVWTTSA